MAIRKLKTGWQADIQAGGRGAKRIRKTFPTQAEAKRYEAYIKAQVAKDPNWNPKPDDKRRLSELVKRWHTLHGHSLKDSKKRLAKLEMMCDILGNPIARNITAKIFSDYRVLRLEGSEKYKPVKPNTVNHEQAYLGAVFNELKRLGEWEYENPLSGIRKFKLNEAELSFLTLDQIRLLLKELRKSRNPDVITVSRICLSTGTRWGEAESLRHEQVRNGMIHLSNTKSGKVRSIPIDKSLEKELLNRGSGRLFVYCEAAFRKAIERTGIKLPEGQMTHVLRHTFASHFVMNGGDLRSLQKILGHSTLNMTMRYAHLAPEHLELVKQLNPIAALTLGRHSTEFRA